MVYDLFLLYIWEMGADSLEYTEQVMFVSRCDVFSRGERGESSPMADSLEHLEPFHVEQFFLNAFYRLCDGLTFNFLQLELSVSNIVSNEVHRVALYLVGQTHGAIIV